MRRPTFALLLGLAACSKTSRTDGTPHVVQTVEHEGLKVTVTNRAVTFETTSGLKGAGRGVTWASASTTCGVDWVAEASKGGKKVTVGKGSHPAKQDCEAVARKQELETCSGGGRIALRDDRHFATVFLFEGTPKVASLFLEGGTCADALAKDWAPPLLLAHGRVDGALATLLDTKHANATVQAFLDHDAPDAGTSAAKSWLFDRVDAKEDEATDAHDRFLRAIRRGKARTPDLEAALYEFLLAAPVEGPSAPSWSWDRVGRALAVAPSSVRRRAYVERALSACTTFGGDVRGTALAEAVAQLEDKGLRARAKERCKLTVPAEPLHAIVPAKGE